jgi:intracellular sulfur oxidation DsrE/DsrF family protein
MSVSPTRNSTTRRGFIETVAAGAAVIGLSGLVNPLEAQAQEQKAQLGSADAWFEKIKGKHRMVFDVTKPMEMLPFAWPRVFLMTNQKTGTEEKDMSAVVILRHDGIPFAMADPLWQKYKFGELFKVEDGTTKAPSVRNAFWQPKEGTYKIPGIGQVAIGINELQQSGVMFGVCDVALTVFSAVVAENTKQKPEDVKKEWVAGLLPGIQIVPSGVWAINRAQEHGCSYCFVG